jgi:hypothetical protein
MGRPPTKSPVRTKARPVRAENSRHTGSVSPKTLRRSATWRNRQPRGRGKPQRRFAPSARGACGTSSSRQRSSPTAWAPKRVTNLVALHDTHRSLKVRHTACVIEMRMREGKAARLPEALRRSYAVTSRADFSIMPTSMPATVLPRTARRPGYAGFGSGLKQLYLKDLKAKNPQPIKAKRCLIQPVGTDGRPVLRSQPSSESR